MTNNPNPIDIHVGGRVRAMRTLRGMSQSRLAQNCGLSFQQIQKYERGANRIGASRLVQIATALATTPGHFFEGMQAGRQPEPAETFRREHLELIRDFDRIPHAPTQKQIRGLIKTIADQQQAAIGAAPLAAE